MAVIIVEWENDEDDSVFFPNRHIAAAYQVFPYSGADYGMLWINPITQVLRGGLGGYTQISLHVYPSKTSPLNSCNTTTEKVSICWPFPTSIFWRRLSEFDLIEIVVCTRMKLETGKIPNLIPQDSSSWASTLSSKLSICRYKVQNCSKYRNYQDIQKLLVSGWRTHLVRIQANFHPIRM